MGKQNGHGSTPPAAVRTVEERTLPVKLTSTELLERGERMADAEIAIDVLKAKRGLLGTAIKKEEKQRAALALVIERGTEDRQVRCAWIEDYAHNVWNLVRQDTASSRPTSTPTPNPLGGMRWPSLYCLQM